MALLKWYVKDYNQSLFYLDEVLKTGYERGLVFYLKALNFFSKNQNKELINYLKNDLMLNQSSPLIQEFHQEMNFMLAQAHMNQGDFAEAEKAVTKVLNADPFFYKEYKYSPFIAIEKLNWSFFYPYCENSLNLNENNIIFEALYGFCLLKKGNISTGFNFIEQIKNKDPEDALFLSLFAYALMLRGENLYLEKILSIINYNNKNPDLILPHIINSYFLESKKDWGKALQSWKKLLELNPQNLSALAGVAIANYELNDNIPGDIYLKKALKIYPHHIRLLSYQK